MWSIASKFIKSNSGLIFIITLTVILKLLYLLIYQGTPVWNQLTVDNYYHHNWALDIAGGNVLGDTTYFRAPFYVYCLALLYSIFGTSLWVGRLFGLVVGVLSVLMTYRIGRRVFGHRIGLVAAAIHMVYPAHLYFDGELLLDPLFTLLLQWSVLRALVWWETKKPGDIFFTGLVIGLAAITRPTALILLPLLALVAMTLLERARVVLAHVGLLALGTILIIMPVTIRNIVKADDPVLIASQGGINLYLGNNDSADGISAVMPEPLGFNWRISQITHIAESEMGRDLKPGEVSSFWFDKSKDWILSNPGQFMSLYLKKLYWNLSNGEVSNNRDLSVFFRRIPILRYNPLSFGILLGLTIFGVILCLNESKKGTFLFTLIVTYTVVSAFFFFSSRFRLPLLPYYVIISSASLYWLTGKLLESPRQILWPLVSVIVAGLFSFYPMVPFPPGDPSQHLISRGLYYMATERYTEALGEFQQARAIDPGFPETNLNIGAAFVHLGQLDSAEYYFLQEKRLNPGRDKADINLASISLLQGQIEDAIRKVGVAIQSRPYDPLANMVLLRALFEDSTMSVEALLDSVTSAASRTGNDIYVLNDAALQFSAKGHFEAAAGVLELAAIATPPPIEIDDYAFERNFRNSRSNWNLERARSYYQLGYLSGLGGSFVRSIEFSGRAIELDSSLAEAYINLTNAYALTGQTEKARQTLDIAIAKFPDNDYVEQLKLRFRQ